VKNRLESYFQMVKAKRGAGIAAGAGGHTPSIIPIAVAS